MPGSTSPALKIELLSKHHNRTGFKCGEQSLDQYIKTQAMQDVKRRANGVFVLIDPIESSEIMGYYTLCATIIALGDVPITAKKHIPRYPLVSATLIGRLAVLKKLQGNGLGALLLADAVRRAYESSSIIGSSMLIVDALTVRAAKFYEANGFVRLPDSLRLILPMNLIAKIV